MGGRYKVYSEYKDSGVEWLGQVPGYWKIASIGRLFDIKAGGDLKEEFFSKDKTIQHCYPIYTNTVVSKQVYGFTNKPFFKKNTITVTGRGDVGYAIYRDHPYDAIIRLLVLSPRDKKTCKFFMYYLNSVLDFKVENTAINQLSTMQISPYRITYPPFEEQTQIANFLDHETAKIDTLIEKQKQLIKLLKEKRQAVISHAVTKGLNPDASMKDSGVEWLGEVPEHWDVKRLKSLVKIRKRIAGSLGYDVLSITQKGIKIKDISSGDGQLSMDYSKYQIVNKGDFAMNHMDLLTGFVDISNYNGVTSPDYRVFTLEDKNSRPEYYLYFMQMGYINKLFFPFGRGAAHIGRWRLPTEAFNEFRAPCPPESEQELISSFIQSNLEKMNHLEEKARNAIGLMQERRTALISAAVTGKIDVRDWKQPGDNG